MAIFPRRRAVTAGASVAPPDYNGQPLPPPTANDFVANLQRRFWDYCHTEGLARFSVAFVADAASRVDLCAERYIPEIGDWVQDFDTNEHTKRYKDQAQFVNTLIAMWRGAYTDQAQTLWSMIWHKRSAGEVYMLTEYDTPGLGVTYTPYGFQACTRKLSPTGQPGWQIKNRPEEPGRWVPDNMVVRNWNPHPDWPLLPYSALWAGLKDLDRHRLMSRVIDRGANAALIARGLLWVPGEAMDETITTQSGQTVPKLQADYYTAAKQTLNSTSDNDVAGIVPFLIHWDSDLGAPERIDFKLPFDEEWMKVRHTTIEDFARSVDLPSITVMNGGAGGGADGGGQNHWSDLLVDRRTFDMTVGRDLDTLCHEDLTRYFLRPQLSAHMQALGLQGGESRLWRVGFDATRLIVNQDLSLKSMDAYRIGLINIKAALKRLGFRQDEIAGPEDIARLAELITKSTQSLGMTRVRRRPTEANADGKGAQVNTPITSSAAFRELPAGCTMADVFDAGMLALSESGGEIVWLDS